MRTVNECKSKRDNKKHRARARPDGIEAKVTVSWAMWKFMTENCAVRGGKCHIRAQGRSPAAAVLKGDGN